MGEMINWYGILVGKSEKRSPGYTGKFKKKVTLSHVYNEVTSEPTITRYTTIVRKTLKGCL
jgi:hypothetical protein